MKRSHESFAKTPEQLIAESPAPSSGEMRIRIDQVKRRLESQAENVESLPLMDESEPTAHSPVRFWRKRLTVAVGVLAVVLIVLIRGPVLWNGKPEIDTHAVVESVDGGLFRVSPRQALQVGNRINAGDVVRSERRIGTVLALADGTRIEMRPQSTLSMGQANDGVRIRLDSGGIIVTAAKQHRGHLYVQTKDVTVSVIGTVFLVNTEEAGSRVEVIQGEVSVQHGKTSKSLLPGQQVLFIPLQTSSGFAQPPSAAPAQSAAQAFEVASIKPWALDNANTRETQILANGGDPADGRFNPTGRFTATAITLKRLVEWAYSIPPDRVEGGPEWIRSERYSVEAKAEDGAMVTGDVDLRYAQLRSMLQTLLADRFKLKVHLQPKEISVYALVVAKDGPKLQKADRDCSSATASAPQAPLCHGFTGGGARQGTIGQSINMAELAGFLGGRGTGLDRPVVDQTGIQGMYDLKIPPWNFYYLQQEPEGDRRGLRTNAEGTSDFSSLPSLFTILEEQFGLKLQSAKAAMDRLVIDSASQPTGN